MPDDSGRYRAHMGGAVPHVELSLIESATRHAPTTPAAAPEETSPADRAGTVAAPVAQAAHRARWVPAEPSSFERWSAVVADAVEPCLVLDVEGVIVASSGACADLIGLGDAASARGRQIREAVVDLVDFTASLDKLDSAEADKIPPLLAISSGRLARGLMRVACPVTKRVCTMDAIATPLWDDQRLAGSLTFFSKITDM